MDGIPEWIVGLLVSTIFVRSRGRPDHMSSTRLADALGNESREDSHVQDITGVDKSAWGGCWELCKACNSLLCGDEGTVDVNSRVVVEVVQGKGEGIVGGGEM